MKKATVLFLETVVIATGQGIHSDTHKGLRAQTLVEAGSSAGLDKAIEELICKIAPRLAYAVVVVSKLDDSNKCESPEIRIYTKGARERGATLISIHEGVFI